MTRTKLTTILLALLLSSAGLVFFAPAPPSGDGTHIIQGGHCGCLNNNGDCDMPCSQCCVPPPCKGTPSGCCAPVTSR